MATYFIGWCLVIPCKQISGKDSRHCANYPLTYSRLQVSLPDFSYGEQERQLNMLCFVGFVLYHILLFLFVGAKLRIFFDTLLFI